MSNSRTKFDELVKLLLIGDSGVGKSSVLMRFAEDSFSPSFITTIGIDFKIKTVEAKGKVVKLQVWDTAGQERFRTITTAYYRGAMGILLVYDVTDENTFFNIKNWMKQIELNASEDVVRVLIGNKCDVTDEERQVSMEQGRALAAEYGVQFFETSAKNSVNVSDCFLSVTEQVLVQMDAANQPAHASGGGGGLRLDGNGMKQGGGGKPKCCPS